MTLRIIPYGTDARLPYCRTALLPSADLLSTLYPTVHTLCLLPLPTTRDGALLRDTHIPLHTLLCPDTLAVGYALPADFTAAMHEAGGYTLDVAADARFTEDNAYLSALGTLSHLLTTLPRAPHEWHVGILGYGRIGKGLCRLLLPLGASLRVYTSRADVRASLASYGVGCADSAQRPLSFEGLDVLINTAPVGGLIDEHALGVPPLVLELASGSNIAQDIPHTALPSLPARCFAQSAGEALARSILRMAKARHEYSTMKGTRL